MSDAERSIDNDRVFRFPREKVFAAWIDPRKLARWWGPKDFTNEFHEFAAKPGGEWRFTMKGPDGAEFQNTCTFLEVAPPARIVIEHHLPFHHFLLTATFTPKDGGTEVRFHMVFDDAEEVRKLGSFIKDANEQNFDRLQAVLEA